MRCAVHSRFLVAPLTNLFAPHGKRLGCLASVANHRYWVMEVGELLGCTALRGCMDWVFEWEFLCASYFPGAQSGSDLSV